jgi:hypothetical protein
MAANPRTLVLLSVLAFVHYHTIRVDAKAEVQARRMSESGRLTVVASHTNAPTLAQPANAPRQAVAAQPLVLGGRPQRQGTRAQPIPYRLPSAKDGVALARYVP